MTFEIRDALGSDWVWLTAYWSEHEKAPPQQEIIARMVPSLDEEAAMALPVDVFRSLFDACSKKIVGDSDAESD